MCKAYPLTDNLRLGPCETEWAGGRWSEQVALKTLLINNNTVIVCDVLPAVVGRRIRETFN